MKRRERYVTFITLAIILVAVAYIFLVLKYQSADPFDLVRYTVSRTWVIDSTYSQREPVTQLERDYYSLTDSAWSYNFVLYAQNKVSHILNVDSILYVDQITGESAKASFWSTSVIGKPNRDFIIHRVPGNVSFSIWIGHSRKWGLKAQNLLDRTFQDKHICLLVMTDRGSNEVIPTIAQTNERLTSKITTLKNEANK